jgi:hypothetical protein
MLQEQELEIFFKKVHDLTNYLGLVFLIDK